MRKEFPRVQVIVVSGGDSSGRLDLRKDAEFLGAAASLKKPFPPSALLETIREVLQLDSDVPPSP